MKLRSYLIALVVGSVLPVVLFAGVMTYLSYRQQREYLASGMTERSRAISAALDREFLISIQSLKVLGASSNLDKGKLAEFYGDMKGALAAYRRAWQNLTLTDPFGQQLINLRRPLGSPLPPTGNPEAIERVRQSKEAAVANLSPGPVTGTLGIVVHVPVLKEGQVKYVLNAVFYPAPLTDLLFQQKLPSGWIATIIDRNHNIVATTRDFEKFFGKPAPSTFAAHAKQYQEAIWRGTTIDGLPAVAALHSSDFTGWTVGVTIPLSLLEAPMKRSMMILAAGGLLLFLTGIGLAFLFGLRISRPIASLSAAAAALGKGEIPRSVASPIIEVNQAARAFEDAAASRHRAQQEALKNYERFLLLVESAPDSMVIVDQEGKIFLVNAQTERLFGYQREELYGQAVEILMPEQYRGRYAEHRRGYVAHPHTRSMGIGLELFARRKDGNEFPVEISLSSHKTDEGLLITSTIRDISELKRAEELLRTANLELERRVEERTRELAQANKELEAFSYSVSHDLRAPLRSIDGFSQALLEDYADRLDEEGKDYLQRVRASTQRMSELIDDMLNLSRVTRGEMRRESVDLTGMAQVLAAELQQSAPDREVEFVIADGLTTHGDARLLRIVMDNLLGNAWKYTSKHPRARIEFGFVQNNGQSAYFVRDDGAGFDMAYADKLFGVFQRLHRQTEFSGTGVGLATVQRIMHRHGGQVWAEAQVDKGATFYFTVERTQHER